MTVLKTLLKRNDEIFKSRGDDSESLSEFSKPAAHNESTSTPDLQCTWLSSKKAGSSLCNYIIKTGYHIK